MGTRSVQMNSEQILEWAKEHRNEILEDFIIEGLTWSDMRERIKEQCDSYWTQKQWTTVLTKEKIHKYHQFSEAVEVIAKLKDLNLQSEDWNLLPIAEGILLNASKMEKYLGDTKKTQATVADMKAKRHLIFIPLKFKYSTLSQPKTFKEVQHMLFLAAIHFHSSFDSNTWRADAKGLYNRDDTMRAGLTALSLAHNSVVRINNQLQKNDFTEIESLRCEVFKRLEQAIDTQHHRQTSDILAIMWLLRKGRLYNRNGVKVILDIQTRLYKYLENEDGKYWLKNDPRRRLLIKYADYIEEADNDPDGHFWLTYDAYCRYLWKMKFNEMLNDDMSQYVDSGEHYESTVLETGDQVLQREIKCYYSYNQAAFPRVEAAQFYELFSGKEMSEIFRILEEGDRVFEQFSTASFTFHHTAFHYLFSKGDYFNAEKIASILVQEIRTAGYDQSATHGQANFDVAKTYHLLGNACEAQAKCCTNWKEKLAGLRSAQNHYQAACDKRLPAALERECDFLIMYIRSDLSNIEKKLAEIGT